jgi:hypothetical protein
MNCSAVSRRPIFKSSRDRRAMKRRRFPVVA